MEDSLTVVRGTLRDPTTDVEEEGFCVWNGSFRIREFGHGTLFTPPSVSRGRVSSVNESDDISFETELTGVPLTGIEYEFQSQTDDFIE